MTLDDRFVRRSFGAAASTYERSSMLQAEVRDRLFERLDMTLIDPDRVLDLGCGPTDSPARLMQRYPDASVLAMDVALPMLQKQRGPGVVADARALPVADHSQDLVFSNLMLQWCEPMEAVFNEVRRVLRPSGLFLFTTFGTATLVELRESFQAVDEKPHVHDFPDVHQVGDQLLAAGFADPVVDVEQITINYATVMQLMRDLKGLGAHYADQDRHRGLTGKERMQAMRDTYHQKFESAEQLPSTWEIVYGHAIGPRPGVVRREAEMSIASFSVDDLRGSRRGR